MKNAKLKKIELHKYFDTDGYEAELERGLLIEGIAKDKYSCKPIFAILPATPCWCSYCNGTGGRSKYDIGGYNIDSMMQDDDDGEFREAYFSGKTDVTCNECKGTGVVFEVDEDNLTDVQKRIMEDNRDMYYIDYENEQEREAERRMGC